MQLSQLRHFADTNEYKHYSQFVSAINSLNQAVAQKSPDHDQLLQRYNDLVQLKQMSVSYQSLYESSEKKLRDITLEYQDKFKALQNANILSAFYKESLEDVTHQYLDELSKTLTEVYCSVYDCTDKQVQLVLEDYRGKKVVRLKYLKSYEGQLYPESLEDDGGSAQIILGLIIAIYFILATNSPRLICIDESLSAISTGVLQRFLDVLKKFSTELGFCFLVIDHSPFRFRNHIDQLFTVENGLYREITGSEIDSFIENTKGEDDA